MDNNPLNILAIDDNEDNLTSVKALIRESFPQALVLTATEAGKGIELAQAENPDVILLDVVMPGMDGFKACQQLKTNPLTQSIPVVFLTAIKGDKEARIRALEVGAEAFLSKPIDEIELTAQIRAMQKIKAASERERAEKENLSELVAARTRELEVAHTATLNLLEDLRKENEARQESESQLRLLFENMPSGVVVHAADTAVLFANPEALRLLGLTLDQMLGKTATDPAWCFLREDGGSLALEDYPVNRLRTSGKPFLGQIIGIRLPDRAEPNWVQCSAYPQLDASGQISQVIVAFTDITERKQAEEALRESEQRHRDYLTHTPYGIFVADEQGRYVQVNPAACSITGYSEKELLSKSVSDLHGEESREDAARHFQAVVRKGKATGELKFRPKSGESRWWFVSAVKISDTRFLGFCNDITDRKQAEEKEAASQALLRLVLDRVPAYICAKNLAGRFLMVNQKLADFYGRSIASMTGSLHADLCEDKEELRVMLAADRAVIESGQFQCIPEETMKNPDGSITVLETYKIPFTAHNEPAVLVASTDITERKRAEAELRASQQLAESIIESIPGTFYMLDEAGKYVRWSAYQRDEIVGKPDDQMAGFAAVDTIHPDDRALIQTRIASVLRTGVVETVEGRVLLRGGPKFQWLLMTGRQLVVAGHPYLVGIGIDITAQKEADAKLNEQLDELRRWQAVTLGREDRVQELKREVNEACRRLGEPVRYPSQESGEPDSGEEHV